MNPVTISMIVGLAGVASFVAALLAGSFNAGRQAQKFQELGDALRKDVNGLGRKYSRMLALLVRWADTDEKRDQIAELIEPK